MKNFVIALIIFAFIIIFTIINSIYICSTCDDIIALIDEGKLKEAYSLWEEKKVYISYLVRDAEMDVVCAETELLGSDKPIEDGEAVGLRFRDAIVEVQNTEMFAPENIF